MKSKAVPWTREHLLLAMNLYCKLPFGSFHQRNPLIVEIAEKMGRGANSLAMKLSNFASLDPVHQARGVSGLKGASKKDREMWEEFHSDRERVTEKSEELLAQLFDVDESGEVEVVSPRKIVVKPSAQSTEKVVSVKVRRGQSFFRQSLLAAYGGRCCVSGLPFREMLIASHIKPWAKFPEERLNLRNGLCLSTIHDAAFDYGLITFGDRFELVLSKKLRDAVNEPSVKTNFGVFEGKPIEMPEKLATPDETFMGYHREAIFVG